MDSNESLVFKQSSDETAAERAALQEADLYNINIDLASAYMMVTGSLPEIRAAKPAIAEELTKFDLGRIDRLERYLCAMMHAHRQFLSAATPNPGLVEINDQASAARDRLSGVANLLAKLGMINPSRLNEVKGAVGYRNVGLDLLILTGVLRDAWPTIENKTPLTLAEINAAEVLGKHLIDAVGLRDQSPAITQAATDQRQRAYTLFARNYDEVRAAIMYVRRHEGDADTIAPSLYVGRGGRGKKPETQPATPAHASPVAPPTAAPTHPNAEPGMPGASPFTTP